MITMEKIDYVISVTGASYEVVREALLASDGDVDIAIGAIMDVQGTQADATEREDGKSVQDQVKNRINKLSEDIIDAIKDLVATGNATRLEVVDDKGKEIINMSLTLGTLGTVLAPHLVILGLGVGLIAKCTFYVHLENGTKIDVKEYIKDKTQKEKEEEEDEEE